MNLLRRKTDPGPSRALKDARQALEERQAETPRIRALIAEWRRIREDNHIVEAFEASFRGRGA